MTAGNPPYVKPTGLVRDCQLSLIEGLARPVGPILLSVFTGTNADLIAAVAPLYLTGSVLDVTYGGGKWWERYRPQPFAFHDLALDGVDFRNLPEDDGAFDTVCYDPPYVCAGTASSPRLGPEFQHRYGIGCDRPDQSARTALHAMILDGLAECCRVARTFVVVKCMEYAQGDFHDVPTMVTNAALEHGWRIWDRIVHHAGTGPGGHNIFTVKRARRAHSYLLVFAP
jgi:hypothetical protein